MNSASECFQRATKCEQMAQFATDSGNKAMLLATAKHWLTLAEAAKAAGTAEASGKSSNSNQDTILFPVSSGRLSRVRDSCSGFDGRGLGGVLAEP